MPYLVDNGKYWPLPAVVAPTTSVCFMLCIPNDPAYIGAFYGQMLDLSRWMFWQRDDAHTAKLAAAQMRGVYDSLSPTGNCMTYVRFDPENPCNLQVSNDGGTTWTTIGDLQTCPPSIELDNGVLYYKDPSTGAISPLNGAPTDPRTSGPLVRPYPSGTVPSGQTAQCLAATNIIQFITDHTQSLINGLSAGASLMNIQSNFLQILAIVVTGLDPIVGLVVGILGSLISLGAPALSEVFSNTNLEILKCIINCRAAPDGSFDAASYALVESDIDTQIGGTNATIIKQYLGTLNFQGMNRAGTVAHLQSGDCSSCDCPLITITMLQGTVDFAAVNFGDQITVTSAYQSGGPFGPYYQCYFRTSVPVKFHPVSRSAYTSVAPNASWGYFDAGGSFVGPSGADFPTSDIDNATGLIINSYTNATYTFRLDLP